MDTWDLVSEGWTGLDSAEESVMRRSIFLGRWPRSNGRLTWDRYGVTGNRVRASSGCAILSLNVVGAGPVALVILAANGSYSRDPSKPRTSGVRSKVTGTILEHLATTDRQRLAFLALNSPGL